LIVVGAFWFLSGLANSFARLYPSLVVIPASNDDHFIITIPVYETVFSVNSSGPMAFKFMLKRLRFSYSHCWVAEHVFDELVDSLDLFAILALPLHIVRPSLGGPS
jgi:hypothetical protein